MLQRLVNHWFRQRARQAVTQAVVGAVAQSGRQGAGPQPASGSAQPPQENPPPDVAVVFALAAESGGLVDRLRDVVTTRCATFVDRSGHWKGRRILVVETGVGSVAAHRATEDMLAVHRPPLVISAGFAGGLSDRLERGDIVMANALIDRSGHTLSLGLKGDFGARGTASRLHVGPLLTVPALVRTPAEKRQLFQQHAALACDMESFAVARACQQAHTPLLAVRVISDAAGDELPPEVSRLLDQTSLAGKLGAATGALVRRPSSLKDLWRLKADALQASDRLAKFLLSMFAQLPGPPTPHEPEA